MEIHIVGIALHGTSIYYASLHSSGQRNFASSWNRSVAMLSPDSGKYLLVTASLLYSAFKWGLGLVSVNCL
jgi:hypothetical protein